MITLATAGLGALFGRSRPLPVLDPFWVPALSSMLTIVGVAALLAAIGYGAWSIKPRIGVGATPSPVSWTHIASYRTLEAFQTASRDLTEQHAEEALAEQVFHLARICHRKHLLISRSILLSVSGASVIVVDLLVGHLAVR